MIAWLGRFQESVTLATAVAAVGLAFGIVFEVVLAVSLLRINQSWLLAVAAG